MRKRHRGENEESNFARIMRGIDDEGDETGGGGEGT